MAFQLPDSRLEMPELLEPGRKPVGNVQIDWSHPLTVGLKICHVFGQDGHDLCGGPPMVIQDASAGALLALHDGKGLRLEASWGGGDDNYATSTNPIRGNEVPTTTTTIIFDLISIGNTTSNGDGVYMQGNTPNQTKGGVKCRILNTASDPTIRWDTALNGAWGCYETDVAGLSVGEEIRSSYISHNHGADGTAYVYNHGSGTSSNLVGAKTSDSDWSDTGVDLNSNHMSGHTTHYYGNNRYKLYLYHERELSAAEIHSLHEDPYQIFIPA